MKTSLFITLIIGITLINACEKKYLVEENKTSNNDGKKQIYEDTNDYKIDTSAIINFYVNDTSLSYKHIEGINVNGNKIYITRSGIYSLRGKIENGQIIIEVTDEDIVKIILNGINIYCKNSAPIYIKKAKKVVIFVAENTENLLKDSSTYVFDNNHNEPNAVIFSKTDLIIYGNGFLKIEGYYKDGINSKDGLIIKDANMNIFAIDDGIRGKNYVKIDNSKLTLNTDGDAIKSDNDNNINTNLGIIVIDSGMYNITSGGDGIYAYQKVIINNGEFNIISGGGSNKTISTDFSAKGIKANDSVIINNGIIDINSADDAINCNNAILIKNQSITISAADEAIKANKNLTIVDANLIINKSYQGLKSQIIFLNGKNIKITSTNDAINANESITINDGIFNINTTGNGDAIHAESYININSGNITISQSYEAIESALININGGEINITATNDGLNASKGLQIGGTEANDGSQITINGGKIIISVTNGDCLDSNGNVDINGGTIIVHGPQNQPELGADINGTFKINGGFVAVAEISNQMREVPSTNSAQNCLVFTSSTVFNAGTLFHIEDSNGNNILTFKPLRRYSGITFSSNALSTGQTYKIYYGGSTSGIENSGGIYSEGSYSVGTFLTSFTINGKVTSIKK